MDAKTSKKQLQWINGRLIGQKSIKFTPSYNLKEDMALLHNAINDCQKHKTEQLQKMPQQTKETFSHMWWLCKNHKSTGKKYIKIFRKS